MNLEQKIKETNKQKLIQKPIQKQKQNNQNSQYNQYNSNRNQNKKPLKKQPGVELQNYDIFLLKYSRIVDNTDMFLGPISEIAKISDSDIIKTAGLIATGIKGIIKIPFITLYLNRTKDYTALYDWIPKEIFSYAVPMGSFIDILRSYEKITFKHYGLKPYTKIPKKTTLKQYTSSA